jgi:hypothetical protein
LNKLAERHGGAATVGYSTGDPRYAGGVPLVDDNGVPAGVFDPDPGRVRGEAFLLLAGPAFWIFATSCGVAQVHQREPRAGPGVARGASTKSVR